MKSYFVYIAGVITTAVALQSICSVYGQDWPQWRGPKRDGVVVGFKAPDKWQPSFVQKWKTTVGLGDSTPALVGERLYVFSRQDADEVVSCINANDGKVLWSAKSPAINVSGPAASHSGPRSSPSVAFGKVVILTVGGVLICYDAESGKELWKNESFQKVVPQFYTAMSPLIEDNLCIAHLGGRGNGAVIACELSSGKEKWRWSGDGPSYSSPVVATISGAKQVIVLTERNLVGLAIADGKQLWQYSAQGVGRSYNAPTPIVDGQIIYISGQGKGITAVRIEKEGDNFTVKELWNNPANNCDFNTPVLKGGYLYGVNGRGNLFCVEAKSGKTQWTDTGRLDRFCAVLDAGDVLIALPPNGEMVVFKPNEKQFEQVAKIKVAESQTFSHPVISGKRIFVKDRDSVTLWTLD